MRTPPAELQIDDIHAILWMHHSLARALGDAYIHIDTHTTAPGNLQAIIIRYALQMGQSRKISDSTVCRMIHDHVGVTATMLSHFANRLLRDAKDRGEDV